MKFYMPKYKQLDLGLLRSSLDELDKTSVELTDDIEKVFTLPSVLKFLKYRFQQCVGELKHRISRT